MHQICYNNLRLEGDIMEYRYTFNGSLRNISEKNMLRLSSSFDLFNSLIDNVAVAEPTFTWNISDGVYFGIVAECRFYHNKYGVPMVILEVIIDESTVLKVKFKISGLFSPWRRAYMNIFGNDNYGDGSEVIGMVCKLRACNTISDDNLRRFTDISHFRFVSNEEFELLSKTEPYEELEDDNEDPNSEEETSNA